MSCWQVAYVVAVFGGFVLGEIVLFVKFPHNLDDYHEDRWP